MSAGMHYGASSLKRPTSPYDHEMRRRLWATIVELEILICTDRGQRPAIEYDDWNCGVPLNIHDEDFHPSSQRLPSERPLNEFTRTSFLLFCAKNVAIRLRLLSNVNKLRHRLTTSTAAEYDDHLNKALIQLPKWVVKKGAGDSVSPDFASTSVKLIFHELQLILYQSLPWDNTLTPMFRRNNAARILELYNSMSPEDQLLLCFQRSDASRAMLCMAYELYHVDGSALPASSVTFNQDRALQLMEQTRDIQKRRVSHIGEGFQPFCLSSAALGLLYYQRQPHDEGRTYYGNQVVKTISDLHNVMLKYQAVPLPNLPAPISMNETPKHPPQVLSESQQIQPDMPPLYDEVGNLDFPLDWNFLDFDTFMPWATENTWLQNPTPD